MSLFLSIAALVIIAGIIWYFGGGGFGRSQTQAWIDCVRHWPWLHRFLDRHHGKFRASAHYFEFGGLFLVLYWLQDAAFADGRFVFHPLPAAVVAAVSAVAAFLDEIHQLQSGTRQFRRVDFLHSCCGITIAMAIVFAQTVLRGIG